MTQAKFEISQTGGEVTWYVQSSPNIQFTDDQAQAKQFSQQEALEAFSSLLTMQRVSSGPDAPVFTVTCVKKGSLA